MPCLELGAVLQEELVAAQEAEMVVDPVQESEEHQQIKQITRDMASVDTAPRSSSPVSSPIPPPLTLDVVSIDT